MLTLDEYLDGFKGKRVAVVGAGISNTPLIEMLLKAGIDTTVRDIRTRDSLGDMVDKFEQLGATLKLGGGYLEDLSEDVIFRTPGLMPSNPALRDAVGRGATLTSEMEAFFELCPCKIIGVTGSDGKTTTTSIIAELLKDEGFTVHVGGNIGKPLLSKIGNIKQGDFTVLELSSFQLITMKKSPDIAVVTNIAPNHLDIHEDMEEYIEAKRNIFAHQRQWDTAVLNYDNEVSRHFADSTLGNVLWFSSRGKVDDGFYLDNRTVYETKNGLSEAVMSAQDIWLPGTHNVENFMAAFAATRGLVSREAMLRIARSFRGVRHRIEFIRELGGVRYYNDSIATTPSRAIAGLRAFDQKVILISGGKDKGVAFDELGHEIASRVKMLVLTGLTAERIRNAVMGAPGYSGAPDIMLTNDFKDAVLISAEYAREGDIVLLSPACASFDRFKNFEERGDYFRDIVNSLS